MIAVRTRSSSSDARANIQNKRGPSVKRISLVWVLSSLILGAANAAEIPRQLSHQGVLTDASGVVVADGLYTISFDILDSPSGGTPLFHQQLQVNVVDGVYNVLLSNNGGSPKSLEETLQEHVQTYLQVTIDAGPPGFPVPQVLQPRQKLASVPYAFVALASEPAVVGVVVATDSDSPTGRVTVGNEDLTIPNVNPELIVPAPDGVILVRGHVTLALPPGSQGRAAVALRRTINGVGPVACRSVEVVATTAGDPPPQTDSYTAFPLHVDCVIDNPLAGDSYVFTLFVDLGFGSWWYGDPSNGGASDTIYIDAVWHPAE